jgi:hypothetical protein
MLSSLLNIYIQWLLFNTEENPSFLDGSDLIGAGKALLI